MTSSPFFSKIRRDETIRMIYVLPEMDKNVQIYLASNQTRQKLGFLKSWPGEKRLDRISSLTS